MTPETRMEHRNMHGTIEMSLSAFPQVDDIPQTEPLRHAIENNCQWEAQTGSVRLDTG